MEIFLSEFPVKVQRATRSSEVHGSLGSRTSPVFHVEGSEDRRGKCGQSSCHQSSAQGLGRHGRGHLS